MVAAILDVLLPRLATILGVLTGLAGVLGIVQTQTTFTAKESAPYAIQAVVNNIRQDERDAGFGLAAIQAAITALAAQLGTDYALLNAQILTRQATGIAVTLPVSAPSGWGGQFSGDFLAHQLGGETFDVESAIYAAGKFGWRIGQNQLMLEASYPSGWLIGWSDYTTHYAAVNQALMATLSLDNIIAADNSIADYVNRVSPGNPYSYDFLGRAQVLDGVTGAELTWKYTDVDLRLYKLVKFGAAAGVGLTGTYQLPNWGSGMIRAEGPWSGGSPVAPPVAEPDIAAGNVVAHDTRATWLARELPAYTWVHDVASDTYSTTTGLSGGWKFRCVVTAEQFDRFLYYLYLPSSGLPERSTLGDTNQVLALIPLQYS